MAKVGGKPHRTAGLKGSKCADGCGGNFTAENLFDTWGTEVVLHKKERRPVRGRGTFKRKCSPTHVPKNKPPPTHTRIRILPVLNGNEDEASSAGVHAEEFDASRDPVQAHARVEDEGPDVRDEEVLRLVFFHVLKLEFGKFLYTKEKKWLKTRYNI